MTADRGVVNEIRLVADRSLTRKVVGPAVGLTVNCGTITMCSADRPQQKFATA